MNAELQSLAQTFKEKARELSGLSDKINEAFSEYEDTGRSEIWEDFEVRAYTLCDEITRTVIHMRCTQVRLDRERKEAGNASS